MSGRKAVHEYNPAVQAQIAKALYPNVEVKFASNPSSERRLRQDTKGQNKTELAFGDWLAANRTDLEVHAQSITLKLANGVRYTPDFFCLARQTGEVECFETKGFMRDDASVKIKVAASIYRRMTFVLVTKKNKKQGGGWDQQLILP